MTISTLCSIDPGVNTLGICISRADYSARSMTVLDAYTFFPEDYSDSFCCTVDQSLRDVKLASIKLEIEKVYDQFSFNEIVIENNYLGRSADSYKGLIECVNTIRMAVLNISPLIPFTQYEPSAIKTSMGVGGTCGDKDAMSLALRNNLNILLPQHLPISVIDEHTTDAVCIGWHHIAQPYQIR